jgi:hypothetical protein
MYTPYHTRWPIVPVDSGFALVDRKTNERVSFHRTLSGALRARRELIMVREGIMKEYEL